MQVNTKKTVDDPAGAKPMTEEADIGSGEKTPGQAETEELIRQVPPLAPDGKGTPDKPASP